jgi:ABC-type nitrate/sulfonate/bicarbonate transport system permease component
VPAVPEADTAAVPRRPSPMHDRARRVLLGLIPIVGFIVLWEVATSFWLTSTRLFPPPDMVAEEIWKILKGEGPINSSYVDAFATLRRIVVAFSAAFVIGCSLGVLAGRVRIVYDFISNPLWVSMAVPSVVWAFIFVVIFGTGDIVPISALMALLIPNVTITVAEGTKALSRELGEMAASYGTTTAQRVKSVYLPQLVPYLFSSARVSFGLAIKIAVVAEVIGLEAGIGYELDYWYTQTVLAPVVAWGVILVAIGLAVDQLVFGPLERRVGRWRLSSNQPATANEVV